MKRAGNISDIIKPLDEVQSQMYLSNMVQVPDILEYILEYTGESEVILTSFSISEEFLRRIFFLRKKGKIKRIEVTLDFKATQKTLILWPFIKQTIEDCYLADNHSKLLIVSGGGKSVAVVMSQNLTRGNRYECGSITTDPKVISELLEQYNFLHNYKSVPFSDIYRGKVESD